MGAQKEQEVTYTYQSDDPQMHQMWGEEECTEIWGGTIPTIQPPDLLTVSIYDCNGKKIRTPIPQSPYIPFAKEDYQIHFNTSFATATAFNFPTWSSQES